MQFHINSTAATPCFRKPLVALRLPHAASIDPVEAYSSIATLDELGLVPKAAFVVTTMTEQERAAKMAQVRLRCHIYGYCVDMLTRCGCCLCPVSGFQVTRAVAASLEQGDVSRRDER